MDKINEDFFETFNYVGRFYAAWATFDTLIELSIAKTLELDLEHANLLLHGLSFSRKVSILKSALTLKGNKNSIELINDIVQDAKRNAIAHGQLDYTNENEVVFRYRNSQDKYTEKNYSFDKDEMKVHYKELLLQSKELQDELGISDDMWFEYEAASISLAAKSVKSP